ncbi:T6SS effector phospholipase Tle3 domain-containing protein [Erwinia billingiae]|uniref:T6SS effector phospholipase Tle3 domain-containing protein n=1 Tax=Erwinia billingiae TaxID=182337 RepID=UPI00069FBCA9|nr:alpha/beta hydrolase [Erwinia billingiae]
MPKNNQREQSTRLLKSEMTVNGIKQAKSSMSPKNVRVFSEIHSNVQLPGLIIFVHGVNSEGEWYKKTEDNLCNGLNLRLGLAGTEFALTPNIYNEDNTFPTQIITEGRSPVIRFFWGYTAKEGSEKDFVIPLRTENGVSCTDLNDEKIRNSNYPFFWGGGPFQNGCTSLYSLWSKVGFSKWLKKIPIPFSSQLINEETDRLLTNAPARDYYSHAAERLANLVRKIRELSPKDTVTVISHSQGTMIAAAAAAMEGAAPDALFLMNSPLCLESKGIDYLSYPLSECISDVARRVTFADIVTKVAENKSRLKQADPNKLICGLEGAGENWHPEGKTSNPDVPERDNHGRTYIYCSPHDRVMGSSPLLSIGWQGLPNTKNSNYTEPHPVFAMVPKDSLFVRMLARNMACGEAPNPQTPFGTLPDMTRDWKPKGGKSFWDSNDSLFSRQAWPTPDPNQKLYINAEKVPLPITAEEMADFDKDRKHIEDLPAHKAAHSIYLGDKNYDSYGYSWSTINPETGEPNDNTYKYYIKLYGYNERKTFNVPQADKKSPPFVNSRNVDRESVEQMRHRISQYISRPADHSDLPQNPLFIQQVMAYDLPIGFCRIGQNEEWMQMLRDMADWTYPGSDSYYKTGTFTPPPMPSIIRKDTDADAQQRYDAALKTAEADNFALVRAQKSQGEIA